MSYRNKGILIIRMERRCRRLKPPVNQMMRQVLSPQIFPKAKVTHFIKNNSKKTQKVHTSL